MTSQSILILWTLSTLLSVGAANGCRRSWVDLVFVLDTSASVDPAELAAMKNFVASIVRQLHVSMETDRLALVRFSTEADVIAYLSQSTSPERFIDALNSMPYEDGSTNTDLALERVNEEILTEAAGDRPGMGDVIVVISEGQSSEPQFTLEVANQLRARGAQVVGLAIGSGSDLLTDMEAFTAGNFQTANSFESLGDVLTMFTQFLCSASDNAIMEARQRHPPPSHPSSPLSPFFLDSGLASAEESVKTSSTIRVLASSPLSSGATVLRSGTTIMSVSSSRQSTARPPITPALPSAASTGANVQSTTPDHVATDKLATHIDDALTTHTATTDKMITINGAAADIANYSHMATTSRMALNITTMDELAEQTPTTDELAIHISSTDELAVHMPTTEEVATHMPTTDKVATHMLSIDELVTHIHTTEKLAVHMSSTDELVKHIPTSVEVATHMPSTDEVASQITTSNEMTTNVTSAEVHNALSQTVLRSGESSAVPTVRAETPVQTSQSCSQTWVDLVFVLDSSSSMYNYEFDVIKRFVADVLQQLNVSMVKDRVAIVRFSTEVDVIAYLNQSVSNRQMLKLLNSTEFKPGGTNTKLALTVTRQKVLSEASGNRPGVADVVVVITDGKSWDPRGSKREADLLRQQGAQVVGLAIGTKTDMSDDVKEYTAGQYNQVDNFDSVTSIINSFRKLMCYATQKAVQSLNERPWKLSTTSSSAIAKSPLLPLSPRSPMSSVTAPKSRAVSSTVISAQAVTSGSLLSAMTSTMSLSQLSIKVDVMKDKSTSDVPTDADRTPAAARTTSGDVTTTRQSLDDHSVTAQDDRSITTEANQANNRSSPSAEDDPAYELGEVLEGRVTEEGSWWEGDWLTVPAMTGGGVVLVGLTSGLLHYAALRRCKRGKQRTPKTEL